MTWWRRWAKGTGRGTSGIAPLKATREDRALQAAATAEAAGDATAMHRASNTLIRLELYERAWELRIRAAALTEDNPLLEWDGGDLGGRSLLIRAYAPRDRIGEELRMARFIAPVAERAGLSIVLTEPRLVPIVARSFQGVDARPRGLKDAAAFAEADIFAYYETIALRFARNAAEMRRSFVPLRADPAEAAALRARYKQDSAGPLIGISWGSSNDNKVLPPVAAWAPLLDWPSATFVSLQYGDVEGDLAVLRSLGGRVLHDAAINQLIDLDGFAAQIAALDAVVSISNTTIDMAGMLRAPTLHLRDDKASAIWPRFGPSPWYPEMTFLHREGRAWPAVFAEARTRVQGMLATEGR